MRTRTVAGTAIALIGFALCLGEAALYYRAQLQRPPVHYDISPWLAFGGAVIAFVGGAILDFTRAQKISQVVVSSGVTILGALPFGRRWTDRVAADQAQGAVVVPPSVPPAAPASDGVGAPSAPAQPTAITPDPYEDKQ